MAAPPLHEGPPTYHPLLDDIDTFEGRSPTGEDLDEMARCCKEILPGPRAAVREEAARMPLPIAGRFRYVDVSFHQCVAWYGDVEEEAWYRLGRRLAGEAPTRP